MSFVCFGEIMLRLTPAEYDAKLWRSRLLQADYAGSESNVASSLAVLGNEAEFITKLPDNPLGDGAISYLQSYGVVTQQILRGGHRIGTYFIELGSSIRPSRVTYDRSGSAISEITDSEFVWGKLLKGKKWIFLSGITPALSPQCALETIKAAKTAREMGIGVAFDMNYRRTLWKNTADARKIFKQILEHTTLLFGNMGVLKDIFDLAPEGNSLEEETRNSMLWAASEFDCPHLAFTIRKQRSASLNRLSGLCFSHSQFYESPELEVEVTDRFGTGDAFAAAYLHALQAGWTSQKCIDFASAAFALKHTLKGDVHTSNESEILRIAEGDIKGYVLR